MLIESTIYNTIMQLFGSPLNLGIFIFVIFLGLAIIMKLNESAMLPVMLGASVLVIIFIEPLRLLLALGLGIMFGLALIKATRG